MSQSPLPIAAFLSGSGRTLENLIRHRDDRGLPIDIRLVISSSSKVRGVEIGRSAGIDTRVIPKRSSQTVVEYSREMFDPCREAGVKLVVMAGYLKHVLIPDDFVGRVMNIHPSLLPAFGGPGMYGSRVHQAAIDRGVKYSGCTVHFVDNEYDHGPIVLQRICDVLPNDTAHTLASRVFMLECDALPDAISKVAPMLQ